MRRVLKSSTSMGLENLALGNRWLGLCAIFSREQNWPLSTESLDQVSLFLLSIFAPLLRVDLRGVRNVDATRGGVNGDVVPAAGAGNGDLLDDFVARGGGESGDAGCGTD